MDGNLLLVSFLFGMVGMALFTYGKKAQRVSHIAAGIGLMTIPYFISNLLLMVVICCAITAVPWVWKEA
jgi:hypothetical protein